MITTIEEYIALNNPREVAAVLEANGSRKIDKKNILEVVHRFTDKKGDYAFEQLSKIDTPYRRLILSQIKEEEKKSGCSGCGGTCGEKKSGCCGSSFDGGSEKVQLTTTKEVGEPTVKKAEPSVVMISPVADKKENNNLIVAGMAAGLVLLAVIAIVVVRK